MKPSLGLCLSLISAALLCGSWGCTLSKDKKSGLRDLAGGGAESTAVLKQMKLKYAFIFIGSGGQKYPVYMSAEMSWNDEKKEGLWNSSIDSDGGLLLAINETKTLKPDKDLAVKLASSDTPSASEELVLVSGNPDIGRGLSLKLQRVVSGSVQTWKATSLSYFGYDAQIEDSLNTASASP